MKKNKRGAILTLLIQQYLELLTVHAYRGVVLLVGEHEFHLKALAALSGSQHYATQPSESTAGDEKPMYVVSDDNQLSENVNEKKFRFLLGTESRGVIYAHNDIQPDMFAALAGTIVSGGLLIICWKALPNQKSDIYQQRFYRELIKSQFLLRLHQHKLSGDDDNLQVDKFFDDTKHFSNINEVLETLKRVPSASYSNEPCSLGCVTADQTRAVNAIVKAVTGRRNRPLMISADRGRGKTTALALACCELLRKSERPLHILITAPHKASVVGFFQTLTETLNVSETKAKDKQSFFCYQQHTVEFIPLDLLLSMKPSTDLLLVDEAAALPLYLLTPLFSFYHRIVFSSTLHGYEGAGRGFALKFTDFIDQHKIILKNIHLDTPIRWSEDDPLEAIVFNTCLLNAELSILSSATLLKLNSLALDSLSIKKEEKRKTLIYKQYSALELLNNEGLLSKIFSVLVTAHYQTSPSDLKLLLNNEQLFVYVLQCDNCVINDELNKEDDVEIIAVAMIMNEGMVHHHIHDKALITEIAEGKRRVKNQFLPQTLLTYCGEKLAFDFSYWRIMRIAIHPQYQSKGLGTYFIQCLEQSAKENSIDILGTSFALNEQLFRFWHRVGWHIIRIGMTKDQASGERSGVLLKTLSDSKVSSVLVDNIALIHRLSEQFYTSFPFYLADQFNDLSPTLVARIFDSNTDAFTTELTLVELQAISDFTLGFRQYDICAYSLYKGLLWYLNKSSKALLSESEKVLPEPLIARLIQKKSIEYVCNKHQFTGKKQLNVYFIHQFKMILKYYKEHGITSINS